MDEKLIPAHILFTRWFIRIRWIAFITLVAATYCVSHIFHISIAERSIYILALILFTLNAIHFLILKTLVSKSGKKLISRIKLEIHFQILTDLVILTLILHYSGGIENPIVLFYFFHLIIASSIFPTLTSYLYAAYTLMLVTAMALLEYFSIITHHNLEGFIDLSLYNNPLYIFGAGFVFACTSVLIVSLSHMIISRSIKTEETYVRTNMELEDKDKLKNEYVLRVTHDIKGHVAAILSCIEVVRSKITGPLNKDQEEFINRAYERTELLTGFVKDLLNLTKKRLKRDIEFEEFSLKDLLDRIVKSIGAMAKDKGIDFNVFIENSVDRLFGNPFTIEELYSNLLLNAVKYTPSKGRISLTVKDREHHIVSEISDSGIGIPAEELPKVFDEFYRASNVPKDVRTGSGLGLSIAKQIVENHKGKIWVNSEIGVWTRFTFYLPKRTDLQVQRPVASI